MKISKSKHTLSLVAGFLMSGLVGLDVAHAMQLWLEDFETDGNGSRYTTSVAEFSDGGGDLFTRADGSNIGSFVEYQNIQGSSFFAAMDLDGDGAAPEQTITFADQAIPAGTTQLVFRGLFAEDDDGTNQDWDTADFVHVQVALGSSSSFTTFLAFEADIRSGFNGEPREDTNLDGVGDGNAITDSFSEFCSPIDVTGATSISIRIEIALEAGDEDIAFDNLSLEVRVCSMLFPTSTPTTHIAFLILTFPLYPSDYWQLRSASSTAHYTHD